MSEFVGFIDPPDPFAPKAEWADFIAELEKLPPSDQVKEALADAEKRMKDAPERAEDEEDLDDISDLEDDE